MEVRWDAVWMIIGAALVTFLPRVLPLVTLSRVALPDWLLRFLNHVPVAIMTALLAQALLLSNDEFVPIHSNVHLLASVPTLLVALLTRSLLGTVLTGIVSVMLIMLL